MGLTDNWEKKKLSVEAPQNRESKAVLEVSSLCLVLGRGLGPLGSRTPGRDLPRPGKSVIKMSV